MKKIMRCALACGFAVVVAPGVAAQPAAITAAQPQPADLPSANAAVSGDGRYVAFHSAASNLAPGDSNRKQDIFVRDRKTGTTERVSIASDGKQANNYSLRPAVSGDGRYVVFMSFADNLVPNDDNHHLDIYVHDRRKKATELVSVATSGGSGNNKSMNPAISADGCCVVFESFATDLVADDSNHNPDIFVRDIKQHKTEVASLNSNGEPANHRASNPAISAGGRYVVFQSAARNLVPVDRKHSNAQEWNFSDIFLRDRKMAKTEIISVTPQGQPGNHPSTDPTLSADGRFVAFASSATDLEANYPDTPLELSGSGYTARRIDIHVRDRKTATTKLVSAALDASPGNHQSQAPSISADGRYVAFQSAASNLITEPPPGSLINIYRRDLQQDRSALVTAFPGPPQTNIMAAHSAVSDDGRLVAFDTNYGHNGAELARASDIYIWDAKTKKLELISLAPNPEQHSSRY